MESRKVLLILILNILMNRTYCQEFNLNLDPDFNEEYQEVTVEMITVETTTQEVIIITDIPQSDIDAAMNLDVGEYTTQVFDYANFHFRDRGSVDDYCFQQHIKCVLNQGEAHPVCSVNDPFDISYGFETYQSICDVFLDNCRRRKHFWRVLGIGRCVAESKYSMNIYETRRETSDGRPWTFIFNVLGDKDLSYKYYEILNRHDKKF